MRATYLPVLALALALGLSSPLFAAPSQPSGVTVTVGALRINMDDVIFAKKKAYVYVLVDILPYAEQIKAAKLQSLSGVAQALLEGEGLRRFADAKSFKVDVVEVLGRDEYGAPRMDQLKRKESFVASVQGKSVQLVLKKAKK